MARSRDSEVAAAREAAGRVLPVPFEPTGQTMQVNTPDGGVMAAPVLRNLPRIGMYTKFEMAREGIDQRINRGGRKHPATVLNFLPIPLQVNATIGPISNRIIPACERGQEYSSFTLTDTYYEPLMVDAGFKVDHQPLPFQPYDLLIEFKAEADRNATGGVVVYAGDPRLQDDPLNNPDTREGRELWKQIDAAKAARMVWMKRVYQAGDTDWRANDRNYAFIQDLHRLVAQCLFDTNNLDKLPEWMNLTREESSKSEPCPGCMMEPKKGAVVCMSPNCGYVFNPARALEIGRITEEDQSLERLTREEVIALGVSAYVAETSDEVDARRAAGLPRPLSAAQMRNRPTVQ